MLLIFLITAYTIGVEIKENTAKELLHLADNSIVTALVGKLLPQTILFFIIAVFYNVYLYGFYITHVTVVSSQCYCQDSY